MISIIIPLYNKESHISNTLDSIFRQTVQVDHEIIVVNDGSTDNSADIVEKYIKKGVIIINQENGGPSKARNAGINAAKGDWILFLDADDELLPDAFMTFLKLVEKYPNEKCFACNFYLISNKKHLIYSSFYSEKVIKHPFWTWSFGNLLPRTGASLFHRDIIRHFLFKENLRRYEDAEWLFRIMRCYHFVRCPVPVMLYNLGSLEASKKRNNIKEDYLGELNLCAGTLGERLAVYQLYRQARCLYKNEIGISNNGVLTCKEKLLLKFLLLLSICNIKALAIFRILINDKLL